jgi:oxygen-dependent protoporphyrinogen oxidase
MSQKKEVLVYGSGVSGLIASYYLDKRGFKVSVVDPFDEPILQTLKVDEGLVELAANSILMNDEVKSLLEDLNLDYIHYSEAGKKKFFFREGKLTRWPLSLFQSLSLIPFFLKFLFFKKSLEPMSQETLKDWAFKHLPIKFYERIFKRALQGVYGPDVDSLSSSLVLKNFFKSGSKSLGSVSFKSGMSELTTSLKNRLLSNGVEFLKQEPDSFKGLKVISTPAHSVPHSLPLEDKNFLSKISYHNISTVTLFFDEKDKVKFSGFGAVFEDVPGVLGLILNSDLFPNRALEGLVSETWILDGRVFHNESESLKEILGLRQRLTEKSEVSLPKAIYFKNWPKAFPIYNLTLERVLKDLQVEDYTTEKEIFYFANWTGSLGIGKMIAKGDEFSKILEGAV